MFHSVAPLKYLHYKEERIIIGRIALKRLRGCYKGKMWEPLKWSSLCKLLPLISAATTKVCQTPQFSILTPLSFRVILRLSSIHTQLLETSNLREPRQKRRIGFLGYIGGSAVPLHKLYADFLDLGLADWPCNVEGSVLPLNSERGQSALNDRSHFCAV